MTLEMQIEHGFYCRLYAPFIYGRRLVPGFIAKIQTHMMCRRLNIPGLKPSIKLIFRRKSLHLVLRKMPPPYREGLNKRGTFLENFYRFEIDNNYFTNVRL